MNKPYRRIPHLLLAGFCIASLIGWEASSPALQGEPIAKDIAELLQPSAKAPKLAADRSGPVPPRLPRALEGSQVPVPIHTGNPPRVVLPLPASGTRPRPLHAGMPLARERTDQRAPQPIALPEGPLLKLPGPDLDPPIPVPILSQGQPDKAPLSDPTRDASLDAALEAPITSRMIPAPFERFSLPDPFEHRETVRVRTLPPEAVGLPLLPPRTPPKSLPEKGTVRSASR